MAICHLFKTRNWFIGILSCCDLQGVGERVKWGRVQRQGYTGRVTGLQSAGSNALGSEEGGGISSAKTVL